MACRKNAYRGLTELSEYMEKHREEATRQRRAFEEEQRKIWTPPSALDLCCIQWLAHGPETVVAGGNLASNTTRGCGGCLKAHPRITLDFDGAATTARYSHGLDPFKQYFEQLPEAIETSPMNYRMEGFLSDHLDKVKARFGPHLVEASPKAMAESRRARERCLEEEESTREAKRRRVRGKAACRSLFETVLDICYNHSLRDHLDIADIAWLRLSCKAMARIAAKMAINCMKGIILSYSLLLGGSREDPTLHWSAPLPSMFEMISGVRYALPFPCQRLTLIGSTSVDSFYPTEQRSFELDSLVVPGQHHLVRVYLKGGCLKLAGNIPPVLEVARYRVYPESIREDGRYTSTNLTTNEGTLCFGVTSVSNERPSVIDGIIYRGIMNVESIGFGFNDLLGVFVRRKLKSVRDKYRSSDLKRPAEKNYIKALAKLARDAPGNAIAFRDMKGWAT